jgi:outer membrane lipoprotein-sorting protein
MRSVVLALVAVLALAPSVRADDAADAKAIVEKAITARGDKPDTKNTATTWTDTGKIILMDRTIPYTAEWAFQAPDKYRFVSNTSSGDAKLNLIMVANGEKCWAKQDGRTEELGHAKLEEARNEAYQLWVLSLAPLVTDTGFTLATAKGQDVDKRPTVAVKVTRDKKPAITLYFDKESGLLVKRDVIVKDELQKWKEVLDEAHFSDYKETNGLKQFTKLKIVRDGKPLIEATLSDVKEAEKLDAKLFEKP